MTARTAPTPTRVWMAAVLAGLGSVTAGRAAAAPGPADGCVELGGGLSWRAGVSAPGARAVVDLGETILVAIHDDDASALVAVDATHWPDSLSTRGTIPLGGVPSGLVRTATGTWLSIHERGLYRIEVNAGVPSLVDSLPVAAGLVQDLAADEARIALAAGAGGLVFASVADGDPVPLASLPTPGLTTGVTLEGTRAAVAEAKDGVRILDVSEPGRVTVLGAHPVPRYALDVLLLGDRLLIADGEGIELVDVADPSAPRALGRLDLGDAVTRLTRAPDRVLAVLRTEGLRVIALDGDRMRVTAATRDPGNTARTRVWDAVADGDRLLVVDDHGGLHGLDGPLDVPAASAILPTVASARALDVDGGLLVLAEGGAGVTTFDLGPPGALPVRRATLAVDADVYDVALAGDRAVALSVAGAHVVDVADPDTPVLVAHVPADDPAEDVIVHEGVAHVAFGWSDVASIDLATGEVLAWIPIGGSAQDLAVRGDTLLVLDRHFGLLPVDVSDPAAPVALPVLDVPRFGQELALDGTRLVIAQRRPVDWPTSAVVTLDLEDLSATPVPRAEILLPGLLEEIRLRGTTLLVADGTGGLARLDLSDPGAIRRDGFIPAPVWTRDVIAVGDRLLVADDVAGVRIVEPCPIAVPPPAGPALIAVPNPFVGSARISLPAGAGGRGVLTVHDVAGRRVRRLVADGDADVLAWDGRDAMGTPLPAGVYLLRLETVVGTRSGRVVRLGR